MWLWILGTRVEEELDDQRAPADAAPAPRFRLDQTLQSVPDDRADRDGPAPFDD